MKIPIKKKIARWEAYLKIRPCKNCGEIGADHFNNGISLQDIVNGVPLYSCSKKVRNEQKTSEI